MDIDTNTKQLTALVIGLSSAIFAMPVLAEFSDAADVYTRAKMLATTLAEQAAPLYRYDIELNVDGVQATGTVNMAAPAGQRLVVHSPPSDQWSDDFASEVSEYDKNAGDDLWCQELIEDVDDFTDVAASASQMTFDVRMKVDPDDKQESKFASHMKVQVTLSTEDGAVLAYSMRATKPFRPVMVAKIKRFELDIACERAPNGRTYAKSMRTDIEGRAMMKKFAEKQTRTISNVRLP